MTGDVVWGVQEHVGYESDRVWETLFLVRSEQSARKVFECCRQDGSFRLVRGAIYQELTVPEVDRILYGGRTEFFEVVEVSGS
jgi:hypothetical protein